MNEGLTKRVQLLIWVHCMPKKESVSRNPSDQKTVRTAIRSKSVIYIAVKAVHYAKKYHVLSLCVFWIQISLLFS